MSAVLGPSWWTQIRPWLAAIGVVAHAAGLGIVVLAGSRNLPSVYVALTLGAPLLPNWRSTGGVAASALYPVTAVALLAFAVTRVL